MAKLVLLCFSPIPTARRTGSDLLQARCQPLSSERSVEAVSFIHVLHDDGPSSVCTL